MPARPPSVGRRTDDDDDDLPAGGVAVAPGVTLPRAALRFAFARASGPGGQNVNKVSSKAELRVALAELPLARRVVLRLARQAGSRVVGHVVPEAAATKPPPRLREGGGHGSPAVSPPPTQPPPPITGELVLSADEHRSQSQNKRACLEKLRELLVAAMHEPKPRRKTKPTRGSVERRLTEKKSRGQVKRDRRGDE